MANSVATKKPLARTRNAMSARPTNAEKSMDHCVAERHQRANSRAPLDGLTPYEIISSRVMPSARNLADFGEIRWTRSCSLTPGHEDKIQTHDLRTTELDKAATAGPGLRDRWPGWSSKCRGSTHRYRAIHDYRPRLYWGPLGRTRRQSRNSRRRETGDDQRLEPCRSPRRGGCSGFPRP